jgi:hypothetical protein
MGDKTALTQAELDAYVSILTTTTITEKIKSGKPVTTNEKIQSQTATAISTAQKTLDAVKATQKKVLTEKTAAAGEVAKWSATTETARTTSPGAYAAAQIELTKAKTVYDTASNAYDAATKKVEAAQKKVNEVSQSTFSSKQAYDAAKKSIIPKNSSYQSYIASKTLSNKPLARGSFVYNAPMVSRNNFRGIQSNILDPQYVLPGKYDDAMTAWSNSTPSGRGAFQMDQQTSTAEAIALAPKNVAATSVPDTTQYGFKFLYNPNTVTMNWGSIMQTDPVFEASGKDQFIPGTANLVSSTIDFSLVLNRIDDFTYIGPNGLLNAANNPYGDFNARNNNKTNEYKEIYEKGTMYDLEYLFRVMHGNGAYVSYKSVLQKGITADPGWLPVRPIELHLGNKLRYRVRIASLSVSHTIFNARMIPILSTINISCVRYWDGGIYGTATLK